METFTFIKRANLSQDVIKRIAQEMGLSFRAPGTYTKVMSEANRRSRIKRQLNKAKLMRVKEELDSKAFVEDVSKKMQPSIEQTNFFDQLFK